MKYINKKLSIEKVVVVRQLLQLLVNGFDYIVLAVPEVTAPKPGHTVENLVSIRV